jgi:thymidine phosphorylase
MVAALGGPKDFMDRPDKYLKAAPVVKDFYPARRARVARMDVFKIGLGIVELGGGRRKPSDAIDPAVGLTNVAGTGEDVGPGARALATIHARNETEWQAMARVLGDAVETAENAYANGTLIRERIAA